MSLWPGAALLAVWLGFPSLTGARPAGRPAAPNASQPSRPEAHQATAAAGAFVAGLQARSAARLGKVVAFPLLFEGPSPHRRCEGEVIDARALALFVRCLRDHEQHLLRALHGPEAIGRFEAGALDVIDSPALRALVERRLRPRGIVVRVPVQGTARFELVFVVELRGEATGVVAFFYDADALV